jgi:hypothetical protein
MMYSVGAEQICAFGPEHRKRLREKDFKHKCIHGIGILSAALPGSKFILHYFPRFPAWAKYCRAPRWSIASRTSSFFPWHSSGKNSKT